MLTIGRSRVVRESGQARLRAEISFQEHKTTLWFAVKPSQRHFLAAGRADPFVMALLPAAMRRGQDVVCEDPLSERLHYQLEKELIPALAFRGGVYHPVKIIAPLTSEVYPGEGAAGTGFSGGVDCLYTINRHGSGSEIPLTHLAVFNSGVFEGPERQGKYEKACDAAERFAAEQSLKTVFVDTNFSAVLPERFLDVYSFRNLACAMALQGLFSVYWLSSGHDLAHFAFDLRNSASYDPLTVSCASLEGLSFFLSGAEVCRWQKLETLSEWEPSWKWLSPCIFTTAGEKNCGHCKKCIRDELTLHALGKLDRYEAVFDTEDFHRNFALRVGFVLANRGNHLFDEAICLLQQRNIPIPSESYVYARLFRRAMENLRSNQGREIRQGQARPGEAES